MLSLKLLATSESVVFVVSVIFVLIFNFAFSFSIAFVIPFSIAFTFSIAFVIPFAFSFAPVSVDDIPQEWMSIIRMKFDEFFFVPHTVFIVMDSTALFRTLFNDDAITFVPSVPPVSVVFFSLWQNDVFVFFVPSIIVLSISIPAIIIFSISVPFVF